MGLPFYPLCHSHTKFRTLPSIWIDVQAVFWWCIEQVDGKWFTYFSERGRKRNYREWPSEEEAVAYIYERAERLARRLGLWKG